MNATVKVDFEKLGKTKAIELPSFPGSEVIVNQSMTVGQMRNINAVEDDFGKVIEYAAQAIKSWNLVDNDEQPLPIDSSTLERFPQADVMEIFATSQDKTVDELQADAVAGKKD